MFSIAKFELIRLLKRKWFWIAALVLPLYILLIQFIPVLLEKSLKKERLVLITGDSKLAKEIMLEFSRSPFFNSWKVEIIDGEKDSLEKSKKRDVYVLMQLSKDEVKIYLKKFEEIFIGDLKRIIKNGYFNYFLIMKGFKLSELDLLREGPVIKLMGFKEENEKNIGFLIFIFSLLLYSGLMGYGWLISQRIIEDKQTRFIEILLLYRKPHSILTGKLFGVGSGYIIQLLTSFVSGYILISLSTDFLKKTFRNLSIDINFILLIILLYLISYFMYASFNLIAGAIANTMDELKQINTVINMTLLINLILVIVFRRFAFTSIERLLTFFPLSAPFFSLMRFFKNELSLYELFIVLISMFLLSLITVILATRIFEVKVLGKKQFLAFRKHKRVYNSTEL